MNCEWARALTRFDCRTVLGTDGSTCLEIGTPFSLPDGSAINLYLVSVGQHLRISDNGDTVFQLDSMGLDIWKGARLKSLRDYTAGHALTLTDAGELFVLARQEHAAAGFARAVTGMVAVSIWVAEKMNVHAPEVDLVAELEPYIIARNPAAKFKLHPKVQGASRTLHEFDLQHGGDLIDVIAPNAQSTAFSMRKAGDIQNGPFAGDASPLFIVDDRKDPEKAMSEIGILGSVTRAMPASRLIDPLH